MAPSPSTPSAGSASPLEANWELIVQAGRVTVFNFSFTPAAAARLQAALAGAPVPASAGAASGGGSSTVSTGGGGAGGQAASGGVTAGRALALTGSDFRSAASAAAALIAAGLLFLLATGHSGRAGARR